MFLATISVAFSYVFGTYLYRFLQGLRRAGKIPGMRPLFSPAHITGAALPRNSWHPGRNWSWVERETAYFNYTHDIISMVPVLTGTPCFYTCSINVQKQLLGQEGKNGILKPEEFTLAGIWGHSVGSANGETWRRHRRVVGPAFNARTYALVWKSCGDIYNEMMQAEGWLDTNEVIVPKVNKLFLKLSLLLVTRCGFGIPMEWNPTVESPSKTFGEAIAIAASTEGLTARVLLPRAAFKLPIKSLQSIDQAWTTMMTYLHSVIRERKDQGGDDDSGKILERLTASLDGNGGKYSLTENEVASNLFTILFAGHETTASTLTATLAFLAIQPEEQDKAYAEIQKALSHVDSLGAEHLDLFPHLQACFEEAGRMFPAAFMAARDMTEDVPIKVERPSEEVLVLPKGSRIILDLIAMHHNPHVYPEPDVFRPSRWYGVPESDLPMFGTGPRACLGRKFAHTEAVSFLVSFLRDWRIDLDLKEGETSEGYKSRVMEATQQEGTVFSIGPVALKLTRRL